MLPYVSPYVSYRDEVHHAYHTEIVIPPSEDGSADDESGGASDSVRSAPSMPGLDPWDAWRLRAAGEYNDFMHLDHGADFFSGSDGGGSALSGSAPRSPPSRRDSRLHELGLADSISSDAPEYLGDDTDDDSHETESDGELSNASTLDPEEDEVEEVPHPPQLPAVTEERLQDVWPLGDASFNIFLCPITHDVMTDPVVSADGYTYERSAIARWFETSRKSPVTGQLLPHAELVPNHSVRTLLKTLIDLTDPTDSSGSAAKKPPDVHVPGSKDMAPAPGANATQRTATIASSTTVPGEGTHLRSWHSIREGGEGATVSTAPSLSTMVGSVPISRREGAGGVNREDAPPLHMRSSSPVLGAALGSVIGPQRPQLGPRSYSSAETVATSSTALGVGDVMEQQLPPLASTSGHTSTASPGAAGESQLRRWERGWRQAAVRR